jgi:hypothetical protein
MVLPAFGGFPAFDFVTDGFSALFTWSSTFNSGLGSMVQETRSANLMMHRPKRLIEV